MVIHLTIFKRLNRLLNSRLDGLMITNYVLELGLNNSPQFNNQQSFSNSLMILSDNCIAECNHLYKMMPAKERFNRDVGLELPGCWTATLRRLQGEAGSGRPLTSRDIQ